MATVSQYRTDVGELVRLAQGDLNALWRSVTGDEVAKELLDDILPELVAVYGSAAASLAADWYDDRRAEQEIPGRFTAIVPDLPDAGRAHALAGWATETGNNLDSILSLAAGGLQKIIADTGRYTITGSSNEDPRAQGWQRAGNGECPFCQMIIDRGAVYTARTADFGSHDHCKCVAVPAFEGRPRPVQPYRGTARNISDEDRARTRQWMLEHGYL